MPNFFFGKHLITRYSMHVSILYFRTVFIWTAKVICVCSGTSFLRSSIGYLWTRAPFSSNEKQNEDQSWLPRSPFPVLLRIIWISFEFWLVLCAVCVHFRGQVWKGVPKITYFSLKWDQGLENPAGAHPHQNWLHNSSTELMQILD